MTRTKSVVDVILCAVWNFYNNGIINKKKLEKVPLKVKIFFKIIYCLLE